MLHGVVLIPEHNTIQQLTNGIPARKVGAINASNPCSEYMFLDNTACNLARANLMKFFDVENNKFDVEGFEYTCRLWTVVLEISVLDGTISDQEKWHNYLTITEPLV